MFRQLYIAYIGDTGVQNIFSELFDGIVLVSHPDEMSNITSDDVVLFDGGTDVDAALYGETKHPLAQYPDKLRDERERILFRRAQGVKAGCIGICRGAQLLCALSGGKLIQHVVGHGGPKSHMVITDDGRELIASGDHHQMMYPYTAHDFEVPAWAENVGESHDEYGKTWEGNKEPEVVWFPDTHSLCIQPHPEWMQHMMSFPMYCRELISQLLLNRKP